MKMYFFYNSDKELIRQIRVIDSFLPSKGWMLEIDPQAQYYVGA